jgi:hypothetical protein
MRTYAPYADAVESFEFPSAPDEGSVSAVVKYEWGDVISSPTVSEASGVFSISIPGEDLVAAGVYDIRWGAEFGGTAKYFHSSFLIENSYITEADFFNLYEDMNTANYAGENFQKAESIARKIIDTFCGQNFQYIGNKILVKDGNERDKLYLGRRLVHLSEVFMSVDGRTEDYTDLCEVDWSSRYSIRCQQKFPQGSRVSVSGDWGWSSPPSNIREACALLIVDLLEDTRREHHSYGIIRLYQDTNRLEFDPSILSESTGNLDVDVLLMDYVYWIPDWI